MTVSCLWIVAIDANHGQGFKVMTVEEWTSAWKVSGHNMQSPIDIARSSVVDLLRALPWCHEQRNDDFPDCLACGSTRTKEHHFRQDWCRGAKKWESETFCSDCHGWSWRSYADPSWLSGEEAERIGWEKFLSENTRYDAERRSQLPL